jgi:proteasome lid subunit RPN8/RPN11
MVEVRTTVARTALAAMRVAAQEAFPLEACGILFGSRTHIETLRQAANVHPEPHARFEIDPQALIAAHRAAREGGPPITGYFHSHPSGQAQPSVTDQELSAGDGMLWAIASAHHIAFWRDEPGGFRLIPYRAV